MFGLVLDHQNNTNQVQSVFEWQCCVGIKLQSRTMRCTYVLHERVIKLQNTLDVLLQRVVIKEAHRMQLCTSLEPPE